MKRTPVLSSNIDSIGYEAGTLEIKFKSGNIYQYQGVPEHVYHELMAAPSKGSYFADHIRDNYRAILVL